MYKYDPCRCSSFPGTILIFFLISFRNTTRQFKNMSLHRRTCSGNRPKGSRHFNYYYVSSISLEPIDTFRHRARISGVARQHRRRHFVPSPRQSTALNFAYTCRRSATDPYSRWPPLAHIHTHGSESPWTRCLASCRLRTGTGVETERIFGPADSAVVVINEGCCYRRFDLPRARCSRLLRRRLWTHTTETPSFLHGF